MPAMTSTLSPGYESCGLAAQMPPYLHTRRTSRSSAGQSGSRSSRILKPRSNHNSPRTMERRKTTTSTQRYATLDDHYNMMFGIQGQEEAPEERRESSRPVSWHPSSTKFHVPAHSTVMGDRSQDRSRHYAASSRTSAHGSDFYSLSARNSMFSDQPHLSFDRMQGHRGSQESDYSWQDGSLQTPAYALSSQSTPATEPMPWYLQEWARRHQAEAMKSQNESADFLPIQHPAKQETNAVDDEEMEDAGNELVGMGLYDAPDVSPSWSSGLLGGTGKGLKLEETWQPPEDDVNDSDEEEGEEEEEEEEEEGVDDATSDDGSDEELAPPPPPPQLVNAHQHLPSKPHQGNMDGQSFFFDEDETYTKEWWFQQLKQRTLPVRDTGLGYGWL